MCFGPTLVEEFRRNTPSHFTRTFRSSQVNKPPPLDDILRAFWKLKSLGIVDKPEQPMTAEERAAAPQVSKTLGARNGRYRIGILQRDLSKLQEKKATFVKYPSLKL